jgi:hypothetical protein
MKKIMYIFHFGHYSFDLWAHPLRESGGPRVGANMCIGGSGEEGMWESVSRYGICYWVRGIWYQGWHSHTVKLYRPARI